MKGDFLGFSFDGIHCSQLGITHVSSSDRYDEDLFPEVKDKTIEIPNNHGEYYYGSTYGTRTFEINIAYDSVTETQFRNIRRLFGTRKVCELIFDERPYKVYYAKIESPIELSYVCFDAPKRNPSDTEQDGVRVINRIPIIEEKTITVPVINEETGEPEIDEETGEPITREETEEVIVGYNVDREQIKPWVYEYNEDGTYKTERIYKGEGTISLICYQPFAHQQFKILDLYRTSGENAGNLVTRYDNVDEWAKSSGLLTQKEWDKYHIDTCIPSTGPYTCAIPVYNPGDLDVGFCLFIPFTTVGNEATANEKVTISAGQELIYTLQKTPTGAVTIDNIDSQYYTIEGTTITFDNNTESNIVASISYPYIKYTREILPKSGKSDIIINGDSDILVLKSIKQKGQDVGIIINTRTHLIEGVSFSQVVNVNDYRRPAWQTTGNLYNEYIKIGEFPQIKRNDWRLDTSTNRPQAIYISCADGNAEGDRSISIYYDYLYF